MNNSSAWSIEITTPDGDLIMYEPRGEFNIDFKKKKNQPEFEASVPSFTLYGKDFELVREIERNQNFNAFDVKVFCESILWFDGFFTIFHCKFCEETCSVEFEVQPKLKLNCLENADVEYNLLKSPSGQVPRYTGFYTFTFPSTTLTIDFYYAQSMKIVDVINWLLEKNCGSGFNLESEFLTAATNPVTGQPNELLNLYIEEMSDASNQGASQPASILKVSLQRILDDLQKMYNIVWWLEGLNLRIEHISFINDRNNAIDLTQFDIVKMYKCFSYDFESIPKSVSFRFEKNNEKLQFNAEDFGQQEIVYKDGSGEFFPFATQSSESVEVKGVATDIISAAFTEDLLDDYIYILLEDNGNPNLDVEVSVGFLSGVNQPNNKLTWTYLLPNYHKHEREFIAGEMNGAYTVFESVLPYKEQEEIVLEFDCNKFQNLDFAKNPVLTNLNYGLVESYTIDIRNCQILIKTKIY